jgi:hypothetical protein
MAVFSRYAAVIEADGSPMSVRSALARIDEILDQVLNEQEGDFDSTTRFAIAWYRQHGYGTGKYGDATNIANARNTSVEAMARGGVLTSAAGKVMLLAPTALPEDYDPALDEQISAWEVLHHMIAGLDRDGLGRAGALLAAAGSRNDAPDDADLVKELAFLLFALAEKTAGPRTRSPSTPWPRRGRRSSMRRATAPRVRSSRVPSTSTRRTDMGFQTPLYELSEYLKWTTSGKIQLPDFQRGYKWEDERIRSLLATVLRGHPLGVVMLLKTGNDQVRFKPKPLAGCEAAVGSEPDWLLLDGQQRLTSLSQALTGNGVVATMDARGKTLERKYYIDMEMALEGEDRIDDAVISMPGDGITRTNFNRDIVLDVSTPQKERARRYFPVSLLFSADAITWLFELADLELMKAFNAGFVQPVGTYNIPAIALDTATSKAAVATVFEKVNTGGLRLNVFELLTAVFAGDPAYYAKHSNDFRLNDDWIETKSIFAAHPVLSGLESTDFLQAVTLLATRKRNLADKSAKPAGVSAKREDVLKLELEEYLEWREPLRNAFVWAAGFMADRHIFDARFLPYPKQLVPLAAIRVVMGNDADLLGPSERLKRWFWSGILGELYGGASETRFVRDLEQVPGWAAEPDAELPRTVQDAVFVESRLHSLRTRNAAAYKGIYSLLLAEDARDWMDHKELGKVQYAQLAVDVHHIFPKLWCGANDIDDERRESIVNKTAIAARTNRIIGGSAPSKYLAAIESKAQIPAGQLDELLAGHLVSGAALRDDDFDAFFVDRRERLCVLIEGAMGKTVQRDIDQGEAMEGSEEFEPEPEDDDVLQEV